ncbi:MAG: twin-arginine translocase subunit TatC [Candidatus Brocadiia bacterium]|nr:twin-arginine translocase subunit TatC [Candidatus Brocadiia bacterium]
MSGSKKEDRKPTEGVSMPLGQHLDELRGRLIRCIIVVMAGMLLAWFARGHIMYVLRQPHESAADAHHLNLTLWYSTYFESLSAQLKACIAAAIIVTFPYLIYQVWAFAGPGLFHRERRVALAVSSVSLASFAAGVAFGYFLFIPLALRFLLALSGPGTKPIIMIGSYLQMLFLMTVALGIAFQLPLIIFFLVRWGVVSPEGVRKHRKAAIVAAFILAAVLTPPDPFTQIMMAVPLILLYDIGALAATPSWRALAAFGRTGGLILLIGAAALAYHQLYPVAQVEAIEGTVKVPSGTVPAGAVARLRRGDVCRLEPGSAAVITLGRGSPRARLLIMGPAQLQLMGRAVASVIRGEILCETGGAAEVELRTPSAQAVLHEGMAELSVSDDTLTVSVLEGRAVVREGEVSTSVAAGRTATFRSAGESFNTKKVEQRWKDLLSGAAVVPAE